MARYSRKSAAGVWSFIHIDDAARATMAAITHGARGMYSIVDDAPAAVSAWLSVLASELGAKPPRHVPTWIARFLIGEQGVMWMTEVRGASNAKAKRELDWRPMWPSWRQGFARGLGDNVPAIDRGIELGTSSGRHS